MSYAINTYTGDGSTLNYSVTFPYIEQAHVVVTLDGVTKTLNADYSFTTSSTITFTTAPSASVVIKFTRSSSRTTRLVDYQDGSTLTEATLDQDGNQSFYMAQEAIDITDNNISLSAATDQWDALNKRITNVANPVNSNDAVNKTYLEDTWLNTANKTALTTVNANIANINAVNSNETNINTVASQITPTNNISTLAGLNTEISNLGNLTVEITNLNSIRTDITAVNNISADIQAVENKLVEIQTVASDLAEIQSEIDTVANSIANIDAVGTNIQGVNTVGTVASNLTSVNYFGNNYKISATEPASPTEGMLWWDSTNDTMKVYSGSSFQNAGSSVNGTSQRSTFTATASQTVFTGLDDYGIILTFDNNYLDVFLNGVKLVEGALNDYTVSGGTTITLTSGAGAGDILQTISYGTFAIASFSATAITSDTLGVARGGTGLTTSDLTGNAGKAILVNSSANGFELQNASSAEVYGFEKFFNPSTLTKTVTVQNVSGSNVYFIDGVQQDTLDLLEGNTYIFDWSSATGHPFRFSITSNGTHSGGTEYTNGVTVDTGAYTTTIVVGSNTPTLYYYCQYHSNMGGTANTPVPAPNSLNIITTNQGQDSITSSQYANFDDVLFSASGFTFSLSNGELIATI